MAAVPPANTAATRDGEGRAAARAAARATAAPSAMSATWAGHPGSQSVGMRGCRAAGTSAMSANAIDAARAQARSMRSHSAARWLPMTSDAAGSRGRR